MVGFEYGYSLQEPSRLVIWEAQYGDFVNGAQVMIDEFLVSARAKWSLTPSLVMLLPHGYEGQGPDHSSARPERFLQMAAETNFDRQLHHGRPVFPSSAAPGLVAEDRSSAPDLLTPKSLLRHPMVASSPRDLAEGSWQQVIEDSEALRASAGNSASDSVQRENLCGPGHPATGARRGPASPSAASSSFIRSLKTD